jgi:hypothetical protein
METNVQALIGVALAACAAVAAFAWYRWQQRKRGRQVETWVKDYLRARYGELPAHLGINRTNDPLWPVLVSFDNPRTGVRHRMQFACPGPHSTFSLHSEREEPR